MRQEIESALARLEAGDLSALADLGLNSQEADEVRRRLNDIAAKFEDRALTLRACAKT